MPTREAVSVVKGTSAGAAARLMKSPVEAAAPNPVGSKPSNADESPYGGNASSKSPWNTDGLSVAALAALHGELELATELVSNRHFVQSPDGMMEEAKPDIPVPKWLLRDRSGAAIAARVRRRQQLLQPLLHGDMQPAPALAVAPAPAVQLASASPVRPRAGGGATRNGETGGAAHSVFRYARGWALLRRAVLQPGWLAEHADGLWPGAVPRPPRGGLELTLEVPKRLAPPKPAEPTGAEAAPRRHGSGPEGWQGTAWLQVGGGDAAGASPTAGGDEEDDDDDGADLTGEETLWTPESCSPEHGWVRMPLRVRRGKRLPGGRVELRLYSPPGGTPADEHCAIPVHWQAQEAAGSTVGPKGVTSAQDGVRPGTAGSAGSVRGSSASAGRGGGGGGSTGRGGGGSVRADPDEWATEGGYESGASEEEEVAVPVRVLLQAGPAGRAPLLRCRMNGRVGVEELEACLEAKGKDSLAGTWREQQAGAVESELKTGGRDSSHSNGSSSSAGPWGGKVDEDQGDTDDVTSVREHIQGSRSLVGTTRVVDVLQVGTARGSFRWRGFLLAPPVHEESPADAAAAANPRIQWPSFILNDEWPSARVLLGHRGSGQDSAARVAAGSPPLGSIASSAAGADGGTGTGTGTGAGAGIGIGTVTDAAATPPLQLPGAGTAGRKDVPAGVEAEPGELRSGDGHTAAAAAAVRASQSQSMSHPLTDSSGLVQRPSHAKSARWRTHFAENTLTSILQAGLAGAHGVEFDVQLTKDGLPVLFHDSTVLLEGGRVVPLSHLTAADLGIRTRHTQGTASQAGLGIGRQGSSRLALPLPKPDAAWLAAGGASWTESTRRAGVGRHGGDWAVPAAPGVSGHGEVPRGASGTGGRARSKGSTAGSSEGGPGSVGDSGSGGAAAGAVHQRGVSGTSAAGDSVGDALAVAARAAASPASPAGSTVGSASATGSEGGDPPRIAGTDTGRGGESGTSREQQQQVGKVLFERRGRAATAPTAEGPGLNRDLLEAEARGLDTSLAEAVGVHRGSEGEVMGVTSLGVTSGGGASAEFGGGDDETGSVGGRSTRGSVRSISPPPATGARARGVGGSTGGLEHAHASAPGPSPLLHDGGVPTLRKVLRKVSKEQLLDVELKYPTHLESSIGSGKAVGARPWPRAAYLARVLAVLRTHCSPTQPVFLSSFDWKLCALAVAAQRAGGRRRFPVLLLTEAGTEVAREPEGRSLMAACEFASAWGLQGVVTHCRPLLAFPELARWIRGLGLRLASFGSPNNGAAAVRKQFEAGVSVVCCDHVREVVRRLARDEKRE